MKDLTMPRGFNSSREIRVNTAIIFAVVTSLYFLATFLSQKMLLTDSVIYDFWSGQLSDERISDILQTIKNWSWLNLVLIPVLLFVKISLVSATITIGVTLTNGSGRFRDFFRAAALSEIVFLLPQYFKLFWFLFIQTDYTLTDIQFFLPLSLLSLFNPTDLDIYLIYPLQVVNLFEFAYWIVLALTVKEVIKDTFNNSLKLVLASYVPSLVLWILFITFLTVSL